MHRFKELEVWKKSIELSKQIYAVTNAFPEKEKFALVSQLNRGVISIASNIAEGAGRNTKGEFKQFLGIATGSVYEVETQLIIASEIGYLSKVVLQDLQLLIDEILKMIIGLRNKLT